MITNYNQFFLFKGLLKTVFAVSALATPFVSSAAKQCTARLPTYKWTHCVGEVGGYTHEGRIYTYIGSWRDGRPHGKGRLVEPRSMTGIHAEIHGKWDTGRLVRACLDSVDPTGKVWVNKPEIKHESTTTVTTNRITYIDVTNLSSSIFGISSIDVTDGYALTVEFLSANQYQEFSAREIEEISYAQALPVKGAGTATVLTGGLVALFAPKETSTRVFGCREELTRTYKPDKSGAIPTGKYKWLRNHRGSAELSISVRPENKTEYDAISYIDTFKLSEKGAFAYTASFRIPDDLLLRLDPTTPSRVTVRCSWCVVDNTKSNDPAKEPPTLRPQVTEIALTVDLRHETQRLLDQKLTAEAEARQIALAGDGTPDDLNCKAKKLKPTTPSYMRCREQLVKEAALRAEREAAAKAKKEAEDKKRREEAERREAAAKAKKEAEERKRREEAEREARDPLGPAKRQCTELGFKPGTQDHGKCVMQLSR